MPIYVLPSITWSIWNRRAYHLIFKEVRMEEISIGRWVFSEIKAPKVSAHQFRVRPICDIYQCLYLGLKLFFEVKHCFF